MRDIRPSGDSPPTDPDDEAFVRFLSDTIWIARPFVGDDPVSILRSFLTVVQLARGAIIASMHGEIPLSLRGVVTVGEFLVNDTFVIGPAIDEAAELEKKANAAIV